MGVRRAITGGLVVTLAGTRRADVWIEDGRIAAVEAPAGRSGEIDATGCYVLPGGVDPHTHLLAGIEQATVSAAHGGTTTALCFTSPQPGERPAEAVARARDEDVPSAAVDVALHASIWEPDRLTVRDLEEIRTLGIRGVKLFLAFPELGIMASDQTLYETLRDADRLGLLVQVHCENGGIIEALVEEFLDAGRHEARYYADARPPEVEDEAVSRTLAAASLAGAPVYIVHMSTAGGINLVRLARARGQAVVAEACTHHLILDAELYKTADAARYLVAPPLRGREHVEALWTAVRDGTLDSVGSDHAQVRSQPAGRTSDDFTALPYGFAGLEARLPLVLSAGRRRGIPIERLVELVSAGPAKAFGLYPRKGALEPGSDADLVVWDPASSWTIDRSTLHDHLPDTPYAGIRVEGRIRFVLLRGEPLVADGEFVGVAGGGRYVGAPLAALA
jgi:dihydropyrimidinase